MVEIFIAELPLFLGFHPQENAKHLDFWRNRCYLFYKADPRDKSAKKAFLTIFSNSLPPKSTSSAIGLITLDKKFPGKRSAGIRRLRLS